MAFIRKIRVKGFKSIADQELEMRPLNILIGANGAGKTNLLRALGLVHAAETDTLNSYVASLGGADSLLMWGSENTNELSVDVDFVVKVGAHYDWLSYLTLLQFTTGNKLTQTSNQIQELEPFGVHKSFEYFADVTTLMDGGARVRVTEKEIPVAKNMVYEFLKKMAFYHIDDTSSNAPIKLDVPEYDDRVLRSDCGNLAAFLYRIKQYHAKHYKKIISTIRLAIPYIDDFILEPHPDSRKVLLRWRQSNVDSVLGPEHLADGAIRIMALVTILLQPELPSLLVIDEPELSLHPYAVKMIAGLIEAASKETQVIIATQSPDFIDSFSIAQTANGYFQDTVVVVEQSAGITTLKRVKTGDYQDWLEEYSFSDLWQKNIIGGRPTR